MKRVIVESPYAGDVYRNFQYALACMRDCLARDEQPFASHVMYTAVLDDTIPEERAKGIAAGLAWAAVATETVVYTDLGISPGMRAGIEHADACGRPVVFRQLGGWSR